VTESPASAAAVAETSDREVELAYVRAPQRYGYGYYAGADAGDDEGYEDGYTAARTETMAAIEFAAAA
jgi:hypothetical protein